MDSPKTLAVSLTQRMIVQRVNLITISLLFKTRAQADTVS